MSKRFLQELGCVVVIIAGSAAILFPIFADAENPPSRRRLPPIPPQIGAPLYHLTDCGEGYDGWLNAKGNVKVKTLQLVAWHERGATVQETKVGKARHWEVQWQDKHYDLGDRWRQDLRDPMPNAMGQIGFNVFGRPLLWFEGKWTPLLPNDQKGKLKGLNSQGQAVGIVDRKAYLWNGTMGKPLFKKPSTATAINERGDIIGELREENSVGYLQQPGKFWEFTKPVYAGQITYLHPVALNERAEVVGNAGLVPPTDEKHKSQSPWNSPFIWTRGRTTLLDGRIENQGTWVPEEALGINDQGEILVRGHEQGKTYPSHLLRLTPLQGKTP